MLAAVLGCGAEPSDLSDSGTVDASPFDPSPDAGAKDTSPLDSGLGDASTAALDPVWRPAAGVPPATPPARWGARGVITPTGSLVVFGGSQYPSGAVSRDLWSLDLETEVWTKLSTASAPAARYCHCLTYLPDQNEVLLVGGRSSAGPLPRAAWTLQLTTQTWQPIAGQVPGGVIGCGAAWMPSHPAGGRAVVFGGASAAGFDIHTWLYDPVSRTFTSTLTTSAPPARQDAMVTYDPTHGGRVLLFGGSRRVFPPETAEPLDDLWAFDGSTWTYVEVSGEKPSPRRYAGDAFDAEHDEWVLFGGTREVGDFADLWIYDAVTERFRQLEARSESGVLPSGRGFALFARDPERDQYRLMGGFQQPDFHAPIDGWALKLRP